MSNYGLGNSERWKDEIKKRLKSRVDTHSGGGIGNNTAEKSEDRRCGHIH